MVRHVQVSNDEFMVTGVIDITPDWPNTLDWTARALATHSFERGYLGSVASLMEMVVEIYKNNPARLKMIIDNLRAEDERNGRMPTGEKISNGNV